MSLSLGLLLLMSARGGSRSCDLVGNVKEVGSLSLVVGGSSTVDPYNSTNVRRRWHRSPANAEDRQLMNVASSSAGSKDWIISLIVPPSVEMVFSFPELSTVDVSRLERYCFISAVVTQGEGSGEGPEIVVADGKQIYQIVSEELHKLLSNGTRPKPEDHAELIETVQAENRQADERELKYQTDEGIAEGLLVVTRLINEGIFYIVHRICNEGKVAALVDVQRSETEQEELLATTYRIIREKANEILSELSEPLNLQTHDLNDLAIFAEANTPTDLLARIRTNVKVLHNLKGKPYTHNLLRNQ